VPHGSRTDLKAFAKHLGEKRLSFGSVEELKDLLGLTPGSVSPFGLLNDHAGRVEFWLDQQLALAQKISVHPNNNTATITLSLKDFQKAIDQTSHSVKIWDY
jgi:Ala-tRNA(Pro) deacylase